MDHRTHSLQGGVAVVTGAGGGGVGQEALVEEDARYLGRGGSPRVAITRYGVAQEPSYAACGAFGAVCALPSPSANTATRALRPDPPSHLP